MRLAKQLNAAKEELESSRARVREEVRQVGRACEAARRLQEGAAQAKARSGVEGRAQAEEDLRQLKLDVKVAEAAAAQNQAAEGGESAAERGMAEVGRLRVSRKARSNGRRRRQDPQHHRRAGARDGQGCEGGR